MTEKKESLIADIYEKTITELEEQDVFTYIEKSVRKKNNSQISGPVEVLRFLKNDHISAYTQPTYLIFGTEKDTVFVPKIKGMAVV